MPIPISIILDELNYQHSVYLPDDEQPEFEWVHLLAPKELRPSNSFLQVCTLSEALDFSKQQEGFYYLCLRDRIEDDDETEQTLRGMVIVNENINLRELYNHVQEIFIKIHNWMMKMQQSIVEGRNIQHLLDFSEAIIGNHIIVLDPTFKLLAYTKHIECNDPIVVDLIQNGYHSESSIKKIQKAGIYRLYAKTDDVIINKKRNVANYITVEKAFKYNNTFTVQVIMGFCQHEFTEGQVGLFKILLKFIKIHVDKMYSQQGTHNPYTSLITDLIEGRATRKEEIRDRSKYVNIPYRTTFNLYKISFTDYANTPAGRIIKEISDLLLSSKAIIYKQDIVVLNIYEGVNPSGKSDENILKIEHLLNEYGAFCGISNSFTLLLELRTAYKQAYAAISLGQEISKADVPYWKGPCTKENKRAFKFEDYYIFCILDDWLEKNPEMLDTSFCIEALCKLQEYDIRHNMEYLKILYDYLISESRANQAAMMLNMHRNNVVYHLGKIAKLIDADLDDPEVRLKLKLGYKILELKELKGSQKIQEM